jgi:hypothetical protein
VTSIATALPTISAVASSWHGPVLSCSLYQVLVGKCAIGAADGTFTGTFSANSLGVTVDSLTGSGCGGAQPGTASSPSKNFYVSGTYGALALTVTPPGVGSCTAKFYLWNSAGRGPETTDTGTFFG